VAGAFTLNPLHWQPPPFSAIGNIGLFARVATNPPRHHLQKAAVSIRLRSRRAPCWRATMNFNPKENAELEPRHAGRADVLSRALDHFRPKRPLARRLMIVRENFPCGCVSCRGLANSRLQPLGHLSKRANTYRIGPFRLNRVPQIAHSHANKCGFWGHKRWHSFPVNSILDPSVGNTTYTTLLVRPSKTSNSAIAAASESQRRVGYLTRYVSPCDYLKAQKSHCKPQTV
jgi:hypothetical protein